MRCTPVLRVNGCLLTPEVRCDLSNSEAPCRRVGRLHGNFQGDGVRDARCTGSGRVAKRRWNCAHTGSIGLGTRLGFRAAPLTLFPHIPS